MTMALATSFIDSSQATVRSRRQEVRPPTDDHARCSSVSARDVPTWKSMRPSSSWRTSCAATRPTSSRRPASCTVRENSNHYSLPGARSRRLGCGLPEGQRQAAPISTPVHRLAGARIPAAALWLSPHATECQRTRSWLSLLGHILCPQCGWVPVESPRPIRRQQSATSISAVSTIDASVLRRA